MAAERIRGAVDAVDALAARRYVRAAEWGGCESKRSPQAAAEAVGGGLCGSRTHALTHSLTHSLTRQRSVSRSVGSGSESPKSAAFREL